MQRLLPPFLFLFSAALMVLLSKYFPVARLLDHPWTLLGLAGLAGGLAIILVAGNQFRRAKTNLPTFNKPDHLVTSGLFKYSRNPIYLGFSIATFGVALYLGALSPFFVCVLFIFIVDRWYIAFEEKIMSDVFGQAYEDYKRSVRRWI